MDNAKKQSVSESYWQKRLSTYDTLIRYDDRWAFGLFIKTRHDPKAFALHLCKYTRPDGEVRIIFIDDDTCSGCGDDVPSFIKLLYRMYHG